MLGESVAETVVLGQRRAASFLGGRPGWRQGWTQGNHDATPARPEGLQDTIHNTEPALAGPVLLIRLRFLHREIPALYENHPVLLALRQQLAGLRQQYRAAPDEASRYRLVRHEQLMAQWAPGQDIRV